MLFERPTRLSKWDELEERVMPVIRVLGPYIGSSRDIAMKFMRLLNEFFEDEKAQSEASCGKLTILIQTIIDFCLLPSVSIGEPSYTYTDALWVLLKRVPYQGRYRMYGRWKGVHSSDCYELQVQRAKVTGRMKYIMK
jgi:THO complex subunit 2